MSTEQPYLTLGTVKKREDMSYEEFQTYWRDSHGPLAATMPGLTRYIQHHTVVADGAEETGFDGVVLLEFTSKAAHDAAWETPEGVATLADVPNFLSEVKFEGVTPYTII